MTQTEKFLDLPLEDVIGDRFGRYSKYIIQERALPDARDGLKPVQRRILYAMYHEGNTFEKPFRKAAKTVGNVIGNYHPHGDSSVYEAMVRMSQDWKVRNALVQMHGNNGSVDGDPPAAMRYTEARLSALSAELLRDIEKSTVEYIPNFDDSQEEPIVLPAMYPNLLVNGSTGISAGYATDIPPHQLGEVIDAALMMIDKPEAGIDELMTVLKGPDFPTGGTIQGLEGIRSAYETGKGKVMLRANAEIEELRGGRKQIVITEIPYDVVKSNLVKKMDEIRFDKKIDGIAEVRDDTDRTGLRIVVELKKEADPENVLTFLYKATDLQIAYHFNMVAIYNQTPQLMGLKPLLSAYIGHQREVVTNRSRHELDKAVKRQHIVEGLIKAISILDEVIATIRESNDKADAKRNLEEKYSFTSEQAEAIVNLQLYRLTNTDIVTLEKEAEALRKEITRLEGILKSDKKLMDVIKKELTRIRKLYNDERLTKIEEHIQELVVDMEGMIPSEDVIITATQEGYVKRTSIRSYSASKEEKPGMKETDELLYFSEMNTTDTLLLFTKRGQYIYMPVHQLSEIRWKDNGQHIGNLVQLEAGDELIKALPVQTFDTTNELLFITKQGLVKKTPLNVYKAQRYSKALTAVKLKDGDHVTAVLELEKETDLFLASSFGYGLRIPIEDIPVVGKQAAGVKGINLKEGDEVVNALPVADDTQLVLVTQRGAVKKMSAGDFETAKRATRGLVMIRELKSNPHRIIGLYKTSSGDQEIVLRTDKGVTHTENLKRFRKSDRYSSGSFVIDEKKQGKVKYVWSPVEYKLTSKP